MSGTALKLFAFFLMILDHIYQFVGGNIILTFLGRVSAPIFLFLVIEGYCHTRSKEKYILKLYAFGVVMGAIGFWLNTYIVKPGSPLVFNNIFGLFFIVCAILYVFEEKDRKHSNKFIKWFVYLQPVFIIIASCFILNEKYLYFVTALLPNVLFVEGGAIFTLAGLFLYMFRGKTLQRDLAYIIITLSFFPFAEFYEIGAGIFLDRYQWMMVFSVFFFHLYNHKRGAGLKYFFYLGYPLHIIFLNLWVAMQ